MSFESINLRVALCTDAIIYAPFYLAYLSNDFKENPFEPNIEITIVDKDNDIFKPQESKLRGDDFVLFCLLFDIADVGICDPSILIHFFNKPQDFYEPLKEFKGKISEKHKSVIEKIDSILIDGKICAGELEDLKKSKTKIIGELVCNLALNIVSPSSLEDVKNFNTHRPPSTVYYLVKESYKGELDFGKELNDVNSLSANNGIITCDIIATEIIFNDAFKSFYNKNVHDIKSVKEKFKLKHEEPFLFSGILGNVNPKKQKLIQAFLYCIDKKLYKTNYFITNKNFYGLKKYFSHKLLNTSHNSILVKDLLISNEDFYNTFSTQFSINNEELNNLLLENFINKLSKLNRDGIEIFPSKIEFEKEALIAPVKNRLGADFNGSYETFCDLTLLNQWHKTEEKYRAYNANKIKKFIVDSGSSEKYLLLMVLVVNLFDFFKNLAEVLIPNNLFENIIGLFSSKSDQQVNTSDLDFISKILYWVCNVKCSFFKSDHEIKALHDFILHDLIYWVLFLVTVSAIGIYWFYYDSKKKENYVYRKE